MSFWLTIAEGRESGREFLFDQKQVVIGRTPECDVVLYDPGVSRKHARIFLEGDSYVVEDIGSSNGTRVNGQMVRRQMLGEGDTLSLGPVVFTFSRKSAETPVASKEPVATQSTRIVSGEDVRRPKNQGPVLLPPGATPKAAQALARRSTMGMPAVKAPPSAALARKEETGPGALVPTEQPLRVRPRLSAVDKARMRRSGGPIARLRLFWMELRPLPRMFLAALAAFIVTATSFGLYIALTQTPPKSQIEPSILSREPIEAAFGLGEGVQWLTPDAKTFTFEFNSPVRALVLIHYQSKEISQREVVLSVNGVDVGAVPADTLKSSETMHEAIVPSEVLKRGVPNRVVFDNVRNPPGQESWRIWNIWMETVPLPELPSDELVRRAKELIDTGQLALDRREVGAKNRYEAWKSFRSAWLMLEASQLKPTELYRLALSKVKEAQLELDRKCAALLVEEEGYFSHKDYNSARATLEHVRDFFPNRDQLCGHLAEQKRLEHGL